MIRWVLTAAAALLLLSGCSEKSGRPPSKPTAFPAVSDPYDPDQAAANGDVVNVHRKIYNLEKWKQFLANRDKGVPIQVRITQYTVEGAPIFYELVYGGAETIAYTYDNSRDGFGSDAGRPSTVCKDIKLEENKKLGPHYKLTGCDNETVGNTFWFEGDIK